MGALTRNESLDAASLRARLQLDVPDGVELEIEEIEVNSAEDEVDEAAVSKAILMRLAGEWEA